MEQISLSPNSSCKSEDPLDQVSDLSFERMEKICQLLDNEELKDKLPEFSNEQEETEYILSMEKYFKENEKEFLSLSRALSMEEENDSSDSGSISIQQEIIEIEDTLDEVNLILALSAGSSTPKSSIRNNSNTFIHKLPASEGKTRPEFTNVTFRKKNLHISISHRVQANRSLSASPSCRTQAAVSHSPLLSPFQY
ncbi:hypothetical protein ACKWTF_005483 [Chironomus riparius]